MPCSPVAPVVRSNDPAPDRRADLPARRAAWLPRTSAWLTALVGASNVASSLGPELPARLRALSAAVPPELLVGARSLPLPAGLGLLGASFYLAARRRRAHRIAVALLLVLGVLGLVRGPDVIEAAVSFAVAGLLVWGRAAFRVRHERGGLPHALAQIATLAGANVALAVSVVSASIHWTTPAATRSAVLREALGALTLMGGPLHFAGPVEWVPGALGALGASSAALAAWLLLRPLSASLAPCTMRERAAGIVHRHGTDTLSGFKLRQDLPRRFSEDGRAFVAYRVEGGVMLLSGDPVGPADALDGLLADVQGFAADHGLRLGSLGASEEFSLHAARSAGLRRMYIGDEAIIDTVRFTLEGRAIRKVRQADARLEKAGYTIETHTVAELGPGELEELEVVSARWRDGAPERGFSMVMDRIDNPSLPDALVVVARDASGRARGFLQFVPSYGRPAMSLSFMRRERDTPNGLTEFLIVRAIAMARDRGVEELSLNFAAFGRYLREPASRTQRMVGALARRGDAHFQIESLYRFNAKLFPRWQPRYLLYDGYAGLPRTVLAALWAEGQLPRPAYGRQGVPRRQRAASTT